MSRDRTVVVVARDATHAARLEASLRDLAGWRVEIGALARLREHPDAVVVLVVGDADLRRMLRGWPGRPPIIALSDHPARLWTPAARALGVRAALPLHPTPDELIGAVRAVHAGLLAVHPEALAQPATIAAPHASSLALTPREYQILELIAEGASNRVIAMRLAISRHTAKFHVAAILAKLGARSRAEAVTLALRAGLLAV